MPKERDIQDSPPAVRRELVESAQVGEVAEMLNERLPVPVQVNEAQHSMWIKVGDAKEYLADELEAE